MRDILALVTEFSCRQQILLKPIAERQIDFSKRTYSIYIFSEVLIHICPFHIVLFELLLEVS